MHCSKSLYSYSQLHTAIFDHFKCVCSCSILLHYYCFNY